MIQQHKWRIFNVAFLFHFMSVVVACGSLMHASYDPVVINGRCSQVRDCSVGGCTCGGGLLSRGSDQCHLPYQPQNRVSAFLLHSLVFLSPSRGKEALGLIRHECYIRILSSEYINILIIRQSLTLEAEAEEDDKLIEMEEEEEVEDEVEEDEEQRQDRRSGKEGGAEGGVGGESGGRGDRLFKIDFILTIFGIRQTLVYLIVMHKALIYMLSIAYILTQMLQGSMQLMYMYINYVAWLKNILGISDAIITGLIYCI